MDRKTFIHQCGLGCLGLLGLSALTEGCGTSRAISGQLNGKQMALPLTAFNLKKGEAASYKRYIIVRNEALNYPVVVYRDGPDNYTALLLRCTHQYAELNVHGEILTCSAHGSEFNTKGEAVTGPASQMLRRFPTTIDAGNLYIDLS